MEKETEIIKKIKHLENADVVLNKQLNELDDTLNACCFLTKLLAIALIVQYVILMICIFVK